MTTRFLSGLLLLLCLGTAMAEPIEGSDQGASSSSAQSMVKVVMQTSLGDITLEIDTAKAPISAANFLQYVDSHRFDGMTFYRAVKVGDSGDYGLVQAGLRGNPKKLYKPIAHEPTTVTGLSHVNGAVSMARFAPGSADADFFIVIGDLVTLDACPEAPGDNQGYAVFGRVIDGMTVVKQILVQPRSLTAGEGAMQGQMLAEPIVVRSVMRIE